MSEGDFTESTVKVCAETLYKVIEEAIGGILKYKEEMARFESTGLEVRCKNESLTVYDALEEIVRNYKSFDKEYTSFLDGRNKEVEDLVGRDAVMRDYVDHIVEYEKLEKGIEEHVDTVKTKIWKTGLENAAIPLMQELKSLFESYFKEIFDYHASKDPKMLMAKTERYKEDHKKISEMCKQHAEERESLIKNMFIDLKDKQLKLDGILEVVLQGRKKHTQSEFEELLFEVNNLEISTFSKTAQDHQEAWNLETDSDLKNLNRVVKAHYLHVVTMEAVGLVNIVDLKKVQSLGEDCIRKRFDEVTSKIAGLVESCLVLEERADQTTERINQMKAEQTSHTNEEESDDK